MRKLIKTAFVVFGVALAAPTFAATVVTLAPATGHPNLPVTVTGSGFGASEAVDIYLDTVDTVLIASTATGTLSIGITMPAAAQPGTHYVTAVGRKSGSAASASFKVSTNWAESGFGAAHQGWNQYENTLSPSIVPSFELLWSTFIGSGNGTPAVVGGKVYVGSNAGLGIYSLNATTGAVIWSKIPAVGEEFYASPAVVGNTLYIESVAGTAYALNASNGTVLWSKALPPQPSHGYSSPVVVAGVMYVGCGSNVFALNAADGTILWTAATAGEVYGGVAVARGMVFASSNDSKVYGLNAATGAIIWTYTTGSYIDSSPAFANGVVYVGSTDSNLYALKAFNGNPLWSAPTGGPITGSPAVAGGLVYVGSQDSTFRAFNAGSGASVWSVPLGTFSEGQTSVANGVAYAGDDNGTVYAVDAKTGQYLVTASTSNYVLGAPVIVNGTLYVESADGYVYAYVPGGAGSNARRNLPDAPPAPASLHPDMSLVLTR